MNSNQKLLSNKEEILRQLITKLSTSTKLKYKDLVELNKLLYEYQVQNVMHLRYASMHQLAYYEKYYKHYNNNKSSREYILKLSI